MTASILFFCRKTFSMESVTSDPAFLLTQHFPTLLSGVMGPTMPCSYCLSSLISHHYHLMYLLSFTKHVGMYLTSCQKIWSNSACEERLNCRCPVRNRVRQDSIAPSLLFMPFTSLFNVVVTSLLCLLPFLCSQYVSFLSIATTRCPTAFFTWIW